MPGMRSVELPLEALDLRYAGLRVRRPAVEKRLFASMEEVEQQSPVIVVAGEDPGRYVLVDGRKRVRALKRLRADVVKAVVWEMSPSEALVRSYQLQAGTGWNVLEEGWLVWELARGAGLSLGEVGHKLDRSKGWVSGRLGLVESLPETVQEGVRSGKIGAYTATRHLLPFARANAADCEKLAEKIVENGFRSREVETLCRHYASAGAKTAKRILEDPVRFLKAMEQSRKGVQDPCLSEAENRCLRLLELIGNVSLGLVRNLPKVVNYDTVDAARARLLGAWEQSRERFRLLERAALALKAATAGNEIVPYEEECYVGSGDTDSHIELAQAGARQP